MIWQKDKGIDNRKNWDYMLITMILFFILAVLFNQPLLFVVIGLLLGYLILMKTYDHLLGRKLHIQNQPTSIRLFPGNDTYFKLDLENQSFLPYVNGHFTFQMDTNIQIDHEDVSTHKRAQTVRVPLSILGKQKSTITLVMTATGRGTATIKNIHYRFPNFFSFTQMTLRYIPYYQTEFVIFPELLEVHGLQYYFQDKSGEQRVLFSPYEDILSPYGTRDYSYSDPFHKINWKASAKLQTLQTTVYDRVLDQSLLIIVNIGSQHGGNMTHLNPDMEKLLSYTAYICQYATEANIAYEVIINVRKPGRVPYLQMPVATGRNQYIRVLEMLARVPQQPLLVPISHIIHQKMHNSHEPQTVIMVGEVPAILQNTINHWQQTTSQLLYVDKKATGAELHEWGKGGISYAT